MVAVELEVMAKKLDRFGWERDRGTAAHDRIITDWMDVLQDFPLSEVQEACRKWVQESPRKMPNEGDIHGKIMAERARKVAAIPKPEEQRRPSATPEQRARADEILAQAGFATRRATHKETD